MVEAPHCDKHEISEPGCASCAYERYLVRDKRWRMAGVDDHDSSIPIVIHVSEIGGQLVEDVISGL